MPFAHPLLLALPGLVLKLYAWVCGRVVYRLLRGCQRAVCWLAGGHIPVFLGLADSPRGVEIWHACQRCDWRGVDHLDEWRWDETTPLPSDGMECKR